MIYLKQLKSLLIHKWYVLQAGRLTGVPLWRLLIHDWSKFTPTELFGYAGNIGGWTSKPKWAKSWLHHLHHNPHHPEHWILSWRGNPEFYDKLAEPIAPFVVLLPMPEIFIREMLADMMGTSKQVTGSWDIARWLNQNGSEMHLHNETVTLIDKVMKEIGYSLTDNCDWSWIATRCFIDWQVEQVVLISTILSFLSLNMRYIVRLLILMGLIGMVAFILRVLEAIGIV